jgi:hypothetical protein
MRGRPPKSKHGARKQITLKLHPFVRTALEDLATESGQTQTQVVEEGIQLQVVKKTGKRVKTD